MSGKDVQIEVDLDDTHDVEMPTNQAHVITDSKLFPDFQSLQQGAYDDEEDAPMLGEGFFFFFVTKMCFCFSLFIVCVCISFLHTQHPRTHKPSKNKITQQNRG